MHRKNLILIIFILGIFLALAGNAQAANHYIRDGATGDGSSWTNALDDLPTTFVRGDTYYIADGTYGSHVFSTPVDGDKYITIKKATKENSENVDGWQDSYGDGQAVFTASVGNIWIFSSSYYEIDGIKGSGASGHGIKLYNTGILKLDRCVFVGYGSIANNLIFNHIEMQASLFAQGVGDGIFGTNGTTNNLRIKNCYLHEGGSYWIHLGNGGTFLNTVIENCYFKNVGTGMAAAHGAGIIAKGTTLNTNFTFRYNVVENMLTVGGTQYLAAGMDDVSGGYYIYGNVFFESDEGIGPNRAIGNTASGTTHNVYVYNNTFYNLNNNNSGFYFSETSTGIVVYNNLWFGCTNPASFINVATHNYNASDFNLGETNGQTLTADPFANSANYDFRLKAHTTSGLNLNAPYNIDMAGNIRTTWDRGAYEFTSGQITCITGDIDCDKDVDISDIQIAVNVFLGIETDQVKRTRANVDTSNPDITIADIQKVVNIFLNIN